MESKRGEQIPQVHWASFLIMFEALAFGSTAMCGRATFWFWVIAAIPFYGATWENFFTNTLILPVINGPTEGLMLIYMCHFFTTFVGAEWWAQQFGTSLPFLSWVFFFSGIPTYQTVLYLMIAFGVIPTVAFNIQSVYGVVISKKGSMVQALAMLYPLAVLLGGVLLWYSSLPGLALYLLDPCMMLFTQRAQYLCMDYLSPSDLIGNYPHLIVVGTGLAFGFLVGRMILSHICDEPKDLKTNMCMSLLYLPFAIANALTATLNDGSPLLTFCTVVIHEITTALGIYCFRCFAKHRVKKGQRSGSILISRRPREQKWNKETNGEWHGLSSGNSQRVARPACACGTAVPLSIPAVSFFFAYKYLLFPLFTDALF